MKNQTTKTLEFLNGFWRQKASFNSLLAGLEQADGMTSGSNLKDATVKCYLDGKLVQQAACKPTRALYAAAGRDTKTGEIVLAAVNSGSAALATQIKLAGAKNVGQIGTAIVLSSASPDDEKLARAA